MCNTASHDCLNCAHDDGKGDCTLRPHPYMDTANELSCRYWQRRAGWHDTRAAWRQTHEMPSDATRRPYRHAIP